MDLNDRMAFFRKVRIFSDSGDETIRDIADRVSTLRVNVNDIIFSKGDEGDSMYFIADGTVMVHDGGHIFTRLKTFDFFGKYFLIDHKERSATVTATSPTTLFSLGQEDFYRISRYDNTILNGMLKVLVTRLREMNDAEEKLAELNATKDKFFSIIAHDLRSPISTLISLSDLLRTEMELLTQEQKNDILSSLYDLSRNYLKLLDNLLQWSQIQTGRIHPKPEIFNINAMIREVIHLYMAHAREKGIILSEDPGEYAEAWADREMIRTVLRNLINNALKFTDVNGHVHVRTRKEQKMIIVEVTDNGIGIPEKNLERLFRPEFAGSSRGTANERGTGLGLILSKEFVGQNGGTIQVTSTPGVGSTFSFTVPAAPVITP